MCVLPYNSENFSYNSEKVKIIHSIPCFRINGKVDISAKRRDISPRLAGLLYVRFHDQHNGEPMQLLIVAGLVVFVNGCAIRQPVQMQTQFDYSEHKPYTQFGNNTVTGQGFLRQQGGVIVTCAGSDVYLLPATSFFREYINHIRAGKNPQQGNQIGPSYKVMIKQSQCDAQGNFAFSNIPNGSWFVMTEVKWVVGYSQQGGALLRELAVSNGETTQILLTEKDFVGR